MPVSRETAQQVALAGPIPARAALVALGVATARELTRRPGPRLLAAGTAALLLVLPATTVRALDDGGFLARELLASTLLLTLGLVSAVLGAVLVDPSVGFGAPSELRAAPLGLPALLAARLGGALLALGALGTALLGVGVAAIALHRGVDAVFGVDALLWLAAGGAATIVLGLSLGALAGALAGARGGSVLAAAGVLAMRALPPGALGLPTFVAALLPDVGRIDLSRVLAVGSLPPAASLLAALGAALLQAIALAGLAVLVVDRRER